MNLSELRAYAKSLVDAEFPDATWNIWVNQGLNAILSTIPTGFTRSEMVPLINGKAALPEDFINVTKVEYSEDGVEWYPLTDYYRVADSSVVTNFEATLLRLTGEFTPAPLVADGDIPTSLPLAFHDVIGLYASMQSQIADDELEKSREIGRLYNARLNILTAKLSRANTQGKNLRMKGYWEV